MRKKMTQLTNLIRQTIRFERKPSHMKAIIEKFIMNMPPCLSSHPYQKIAFDTYLVNQSLQIIAFNTSSSLKIHVVLPLNSLQFATNQIH
jgi:hypothetical protein